MLSGSRMCRSLRGQRWVDRQAGQRIGTSIGIVVITAAVITTLEASSWVVAVPVGLGLAALLVHFLPSPPTLTDSRPRRGNTHC